MSGEGSGRFAIRAKVKADRARSDAMRAPAVVLLLLLLAAPLASGKLAPANFTSLDHHDSVSFVTTYGDGTNSTTTAYAADYTAHSDTDPGTFRWSETTRSASGVTTDDTTERQSDGAALRTVSYFRPSDANQTPFQSEMVYEAPCVDLAWPLEVGKTWTSTCTFTSNGTGMPSEHVTQTTHYNVTREERITVPAGTFDTFVIQATQAGSAGWTEWYAPTACVHAKVVGNDPAFAYTTVLTDYICSSAPADPNVVAASPTPATPETPSAGNATGGSASGAPSATASSNGSSAEAANQRHADSPGPGAALVVLSAVAAIALLARKRS